ncbi:MAG: SDR family oxidoreductase [Micromonosporaceae bacterium]
MDLGLAGRRAIVLAGTRGLGAAAATALHDESAHVVTCGRGVAATPDDAATLDDAATSDEPDGPRAIRADITDPAELDRFFDTALEHLGGVDVLVANCGGPRYGGAAGIAPEDWQAAVDSVLLSVVRSCRRVVPLMAAQGGGAVICVASTSAVRPIPGLTLSNALRPAVVGFARSLAAEVASDGVRVMCVLPGPFATERSQQLISAEASASDVDPEVVLRRRVSAVPMGRLGDSAEFGRCVAFLAGNGGSFMTGTTVVIDGGVSLVGPD